MGYTQAFGLAELLDTEAAVEWHLQHNHYPPVPAAMVGPCLEAIGRVNDGEGGSLVDLQGVAQWRGQDAAPAWAIVDGHHLEPWIDEGV